MSFIWNRQLLLSQHCGKNRASLDITSFMQVHIFLLNWWASLVLISIYQWVRVCLCSICTLFFVYVYLCFICICVFVCLVPVCCCISMVCVCVCVCCAYASRDDMLPMRICHTWQNESMTICLCFFRSLLCCISVILGFCVSVGPCISGIISVFACVYVYVSACFHVCFSACLCVCIYDICIIWMPLLCS